MKNLKSHHGIISNKAVENKITLSFGDDILKEILNSISNDFGDNTEDDVTQADRTKVFWTLGNLQFGYENDGSVVNGGQDQPLRSK